MKTVLLKTVIYIVSLLLIIHIMLSVSSFIVEQRGFNNSETENNLLWLGKEGSYDVLFMGISHARNFSRNTNQVLVESILQKQTANIGIGGGSCGANEQLFYLDYFYYLKNETKQVIYVLSPPMMYSRTLPIATNTFDEEPFKFDFFSRYLFFNSRNKSERIASYLQSKFSKDWFELKSFSLDKMHNSLTQIDSTEVARGQLLAYGNTLSTEELNYNKEVVERTVKLANDNNTEVILIIPPALFGKWPGHDSVADFGKNMAKHNMVRFYDCSETVLNPQFYYDHHHLNPSGVEYFTKEILKPIL